VKKSYAGRRRFAGRLTSQYENLETTENGDRGWNRKRAGKEKSGEKARWGGDGGGCEKCLSAVLCPLGEAQSAREEKLKKKGKPKPAETLEKTI